MGESFSNAQRAEVLTQALPYIRRYVGKIVVVKYGGNAMINEVLKQQVMEDIVLLWLIGVKIVLVHGGGPEISDMMTRMGKQPEFVDGLRVTDQETVAKKRKVFMIAFFAVMAAALILIIRVWNGIQSFWAAYWQALLFLEVMNWYDGIVIDRLWVGHSRFWVIPGTEEIPFVQTWPQVLKNSFDRNLHRGEEP